MKPLIPGAAWLEKGYDGSPEPHLVMFILLSTAPWTFLVSGKGGTAEVWVPGGPDTESHIRYIFEHSEKIA